MVVVRASADATQRLGEIRVFVDAPGESVNGLVDLARGTGPPEILGRARHALALAGTATKASAYGGQQVRGASTMRYDVTPRGGGRIAVWVDVAGHARRVQFPDGPVSASPPPTQENGLAAVVTVDFLVPEAQVPTGQPDR